MFKLHNYLRSLGFTCYYSFLLQEKIIDIRFSYNSEPRDIIMNMLDWSNTLEGYSFWSHVHDHLSYTLNDNVKCKTKIRLILI